LSRKVSQTDLFLLCDEGSLVALWTQDYKSLCAIIRICATLLHSSCDFYPHMPIGKLGIYCLLFVSLFLSLQHVL